MVTMRWWWCSVHLPFTPDVYSSDTQLSDYNLCRRRRVFTIPKTVGFLQVFCFSSVWLHCFKSYNNEILPLYIRQGCLNKEYFVVTWILLQNFASFLSTPEHETIHWSFDMHISLSHMEWVVCFETVLRRGILLLSWNTQDYWLWISVIYRIQR